VKWKGYPITEATWENKSAFSDNGNMIQQYKDHINYRYRLVDKEQRNQGRKKTIKTKEILEKHHFIKQISL
jgi:Chromo (CHRromatin Organisation MOdifier) domain